MRLRGPDLPVDCATFQCNATVQSGRDLDVMYVRMYVQDVIDTDFILLVAVQ